MIGANAHLEGFDDPSAGRRMPSEVGVGERREKGTTGGNRVP